MPYGSDLVSVGDNKGWVGGWLPVGGPSNPFQPGSDFIPAEAVMADLIGLQKRLMMPKAPFYLPFCMSAVLSVFNRQFFSIFVTSPSSSGYLH